MVNIYIGYHYPDSSGAFDGKIDQVCMYGHALTVEEIRTHFLNTKGPYSRSVTISDNFRILGTDLSIDMSLINGQLSLPVQGSSGGLVIGVDTNLYRNAVNVLKTDDQFQSASLIVGDGTNQISFSADGTLTLVGTARVTKSTWVPAQSMRAPGTKPASYEDVGISGAWEFTDGTEEIIVCSIKVPEDTDMTEDLVILLGWSSPAQSLNCDWEVAYLLTKLNDDVTGAAQETLQSFETSSATSNGLIISSFTIANAQMESTDVCVHINIMRDGNDVSDTLSDVAQVHGICLQFTKDKLGTDIS